MTTNLADMFFSELKSYNSTNFRTLLNADLTKQDSLVHKSCSSVVTRYFIFVEKHPEISKTDLNMLYYQLSIDMLAKYFAEYPAASLDNLKPFQNEMKAFIKRKNSAA